MNLRCFLNRLNSFLKTGKGKILFKLQSMNKNSSLFLSRINFQIFYSDLYYAVMHRVVEPENKLSFPSTSVALPYIHNNHYRSGFSSLFKLKESFITVFNSIRHEPFNPFYESINTFLGDLAAGGFLNYWEQLLLNPRGFEIKIDKIGPQVLTMDHLLVGFKICLVPLIVSMLVFLVEIAIKCFKD